MANDNLNQTLSYAGHLESDGGAYNLTVPFDADCIQVFNYTKYGTAGENVESIWFKDMPAGDALIKTVIADNGSTGNTNCNLEATNGVTDASTAAGVTSLQKVVSGATQADPCVITTSAAHGYATGDHVRITEVAGMTELNNNEYVITVLTTTTFSLQDLYGNNIDSSAFTAYSSGGKVRQIRGEGADGTDGFFYEPAEYIYTLGSAIMANDSDELYFIAWRFGQYSDLGDIS
jgi:hypothetical protein